MAEQKSDASSKERVVLITGCSKGFGFLTAQTLAKAGYKVYGGSRSKPAESCDFNYVELDVTKEEQIKKAIEEIISKEGKIDILINNAGIALPAESVQNTPIEDYKKIMNVNYFGAISMIQAVIPIFLKNDNKTGHIINVTSCISLVGLPFMSGYTASKGAIDRLTEALFNELSCTNIKVQLISPGPSNTEFDKNFITKIKDQDKVYTDLLNNFLANGQKMRKNFNVPPQDVADLILKMVNQEDDDAKDFRCYPGPSIQQVKYLNANFNNNYKQNVDFGANSLKKVDEEQAKPSSDK